MPSYQKKKEKISNLLLLTIGLRSFYIAHLSNHRSNYLKKLGVQVHAEYDALLKGIQDIDSDYELKFINFHGRIRSLLQI